MNTHDGNPVGRLYLVLDYFMGKADHVSNMAVLASYFKLEPQVTPTFYASMTALLTLPGEARAAFGRTQNDALPVEEVLAELEKAERAVYETTNFGNSCAGTKSLFDRGTLMTLTFASRSVGSVNPTQQISDADQKSIRHAADELILALRTDEEVPNEVKRVLLDHAEAVVRALNLLDISGVEEVLRQRDRFEGHLRRQPIPFVDAFRSTRVGAALIAFSIALTAIAGVSTATLEIEKGVAEAYKLLDRQPGTEIQAPAERKAIEPQLDESDT